MGRKQKKLKSNPDSLPLRTHWAGLVSHPGAWLVWIPRLECPGAEGAGSMWQAVCLQSGQGVPVASGEPPDSRYRQEKLRDWNQHTLTNIYQIDDKKYLSNSLGKLIKHTVITYIGKRTLKRIDKRLCVTEWSSCTPKTNTSEIHSKPIENNKKFTRKTKMWHEVVLLPCGHFL